MVFKNENEMATYEQGGLKYDDDDIRKEEDKFHCWWL